MIFLWNFYRMGWVGWLNSFCDYFFGLEVSKDFSVFLFTHATSNSNFLTAGILSNRSIPTNIKFLKDNNLRFRK